MPVKRVDHVLGLDFNDVKAVAQTQRDQQKIVLYNRLTPVCHVRCFRPIFLRVARVRIVLFGIVPKLPESL